jgi:hypothetical protein
MTHCTYCGGPIADGASVPRRFGEPFCSPAHAEEFVAGVRSARIEAAARATAMDAPAATRWGTAPPAALSADAPGAPRTGAGCALAAPGQRGGTAFLKRAACWGGPLLLLVALPLVWSGGWAAAGGSLLSVAALLACPLGMYFMMRAMGGMQRHQARPGAPRGEREGDHRA